MKSIRGDVAYKRRMRDVDGVVGQSGAVSVVQRVSSDLRLNPHLHAIFLDGVFATDSGSSAFHGARNLKVRHQHAR